MNKLKIMGAAAMSLMLLASCAGKGDGKDIKELKYNNPTDSLSYYLGEVQSLGFKQMAENDTLLKSKEAEEAYIKGLEEGLGMAGKDKAYILGLMQGLNFAMENKNFQESADFDINKDAFSNGLRYAMKNDSVAKAHNPEEKGAALHSGMVMKKLDKVVSETAKKKGMKKIADGIYGAKATGATAKPVDTVLVNIVTLDDKGGNLDVVVKDQVMPLPQLPDGYPIKDIILATPMDGSNTFIMSAYELYGGQVPPNMKPTDIINLKVSVAPEPADNSQPSAAPAATPAQ